LKYGRYGSGYRTFRLSDDHQYLIWFSSKKDSENARVPIKEIVEIKIGKESDVVKKSKDEEIHETSFTVVYGKDLKQLNVTAKSPKEAYVWAQGLKILSDAAKFKLNK
ncbi:inactive phospholipase C-like protein 2, partial [Reticulomyxa filosa]